jgi:hypothetical protein
LSQESGNQAVLAGEKQRTAALPHCCKSSDILSRTSGLQSCPSLLAIVSQLQQPPSSLCLSQGSGHGASAP